MFETLIADIALALFAIVFIGWAAAWTGVL